MSRTSCASCARPTGSRRRPATCSSRRGDDPFRRTGNTSRTRGARRVAAGNTLGREMRAGTASGYQRIADKIAAGQCVMLDGGTATALHGEGDAPGDDEGLWGTRALVHAPAQVRHVHRRYAAIGCDVISTNTWGLPSALRVDGPRVWERTEPVHWMDVARRGLGLVREAIAAEGRGNDCAVAFSLNGEVDSPDGQETIRLLGRPLEEEPP